MSEAEKSKKSLVTEALILAFGHSEARTLVGTDALRMVMDMQYRDMARGNSFEVEPLATLIAEQPGYVEQPVDAALLRFKSWEDHLGMDIRLPARLAGLSNEQRDALLAKCTVPTAEVAKLLRGELAPPPPPVEEVRRPTAEAKPVKESWSPGKKKKSRLGQVNRSTAMVLGAFGAIGLVFAIYYGINHFGSPSITTTPLGTGFAVDLPLASADGFGGSVLAKLSNDSWTRGSAATRTRSLEQSFLKLPSGTKSLAVQDKAGKIRGTAQPDPRSGHPIVKLF